MREFKIGDKVKLVGGYLVGYTDEKCAGYTFEVGDIFEIVEEIGHGYWVEKGKVELNYMEKEWFELVDSKKEEKKSALDVQISGNHYKDCGIQPVEYIHANGLNYFEGNVIKYTTRHAKKNGKADIEKAIHYLQMILELQYDENDRYNK